MRYLLNFLLFFSIFTACTPLEKEEASKGKLTNKYRLIWNDNPQTTMTIAWNQVKGNGYLLFGQENNLTNKVTPQRQVEYRGMNNQFVRLKNLKPDSRYNFKICVKSNCSELMYFKTAPSNNKAFTFISGGDSRTIPRGRIRGNILVSKIRPLFIAHGGDYTSKGSAEEWQRWLDEWQKIKSSDGRLYPLILTHGNHENRDMEMLNKLFDIPKRSYYKIVFPNLTLYTLNTELEPFVAKRLKLFRKAKAWNKQRDWLENQLKIDKKRWKVISYHRPLRPHRASKHEGVRRYLDWSPLFYKYGVQLAIESDSHLVKYTQPLKPDLLGEEGFSVDKKRGTTFIGEGSWGAPTRKVDDKKSWTIDAGSFWQFKLITVTPEKLAIRTVKFGDEDSDYDVNSVKGITQEQQNINPKVIPNNLDLWKTKQGEVLKIEP